MNIEDMKEFEEFEAHEIGEAQKEADTIFKNAGVAGLVGWTAAMFDGDLDYVFLRLQVSLNSVLPNVTKITEYRIKLFEKASKSTVKDLEKSLRNMCDEAARQIVEFVMTNSTQEAMKLAKALDSCVGVELKSMRQSGEETLLSSEQNAVSAVVH